MHLGARPRCFSTGRPLPFPEVLAVAVPSFLARERIVARPGFNRWLIPPAALAVHLCIGQAYATSVYKTALVEHFDTSLTAIGIIFSIAIVMLGVDRKSTRLNSSHANISYAVFCLKKKLKKRTTTDDRYAA